jgi:hypothetical protein
MKIFNKVLGWTEKVNFVDENNVFLGYDITQCCCEEVGWGLSTKKGEFDFHYEQPSDEQFLNGYVFDISYFEQYTPEYVDCGGVVEFRLIHESKDAMFLYLYNCHNGYYGHGFQFQDQDGTVIMQSDI